MTDPKLIVTLEARCYSWEDALKFQDMLQDIITKKEFAGDWVDECSICYVDPSEVDEPTYSEAKRIGEQQLIRDELLDTKSINCNKKHSHTKDCMI